MEHKTMKRVLLIVAAVFWVCVLGIYAIAYQQFRYTPYWIIMTSVFAVGFAFCLWQYLGIKKGRNNLLYTLFYMVSNYAYLLKQLVSRDFKIKYKRSYLGIVWSLLNPLLTMSVQYIVFSTIFKADIENYPAYLLTGIVFFNFFNEAATLGMSSIVGNAALIKKVYMPKYIYPVSKVISTSVNLVLSFVPLFLLMAFTGTRFTPALFLLIFDVACLLMFVIGLVLLLSTAMTFFQDTGFLWGIIAMIWQYLTPVFYPISIIPAKFLPYYQLNPMCQFISFARTCIIDGVSPNPKAYFLCLVSALFMLAMGMFVFRKQQNKFVLYV